MTPPNLLRVALVTIYSSAMFASAQDITINHIEIPTAIQVAGTGFESYVDTTVSHSFVDHDHRGSFELMSGPKEVPGSSVVDIMTVNTGTYLLGCTYQFPKSLPQGRYHFRVNISNSSVSELSDAFDVTAANFTCLDPPAWKNVISTSDPNYRSFRLKAPQAGDVINMGINKTGHLDITWRYLDQRNDYNFNISQLTLEFVSDKTGQSTGFHTPSLEINKNSFPFSETDVTPGAWRIRANYTNVFEPGSPVSYLSEVFYVSDSNGACNRTTNGVVGRFGWRETLWPGLALVALWFFSL